MDVSVDDILALVGGRLLTGDGAARIRGFASLKEAGPGDLTFYYDTRYLKQLLATTATAALVPIDATHLPETVVCIGVKEPSIAFETVVEKHGLQPLPFEPGVHPSAIISESARINRETVSIGPGATIDDRTVIGDGVAVGANAYVGPDVRIGKNSILYPNSTVLRACLLGERVIIHSGAVIGSDGFGYVFEKGRHRKVRQAGIVQIDNDVEIGAGTTIDRARFGRTWIGEGTKIDNLVQIAHNVIIGKHCIVVSQTGLAGSSTLEDYVVVAAQSGVGGHVTIGTKTTLAGRTGATRDLAAGEVYQGYPALPIKEEQVLKVHVRRLPKLVQQIKDLDARLKALEENSGT